MSMCFVIENNFDSRFNPYYHRMFRIKIIDILIDLFSFSRPDKFFCFSSMEDLDNEGFG